MNKKTLKKIRKMKPNENMHITLENGTKAELICMEKLYYLLITPTEWKEISYNEIQNSRRTNNKHSKI